MVMQGSSPRFWSGYVLTTDTVECAAVTDARGGNGTRITYTADIRLRGPMWLLTPLFAGPVTALGPESRAGVERAFADGSALAAAK